MHKIVYRRPGCLLWLIFFASAAFVMALPGELLRQLTGSYWPFLILLTLGTWSLGRLFRTATARHVPILPSLRCPHRHQIPDLLVMSAREIDTPLVCGW